MTEERLIGDYKVLNSVSIAQKEVILAEHKYPASAECRYMCCFAERNDLFETYTEAMASDDYTEILSLYSNRISTLSSSLKDEFEKEKIIAGNIEPITKDDCTPLQDNSDLQGKIIVIDANILKPEYRRSTHQLVLCTGGFGASPNSRGRKVFGKSLFSGSDTHCYRSDIIGTIEKSKLPLWAKERLESIKTKSAPEREAK